MSYEAAAMKCRKALDIFQRKNFSTWKGLPPGCLLSDLLQLWPSVDEGALFDSLGKNCVSTSYRSCLVPDYYNPVRIWERQGHILQLDVDDPLPDTSAGSLLTQLGDPEVKIDAGYGFASLTQGEWFYGKCGLSLLYVEEEDRIEALSVFIPSELTLYVENLRIKRKASPLPKRLQS